MRGRCAQSGALMDRLVHDLKQPLNHIRVVAQDVRIDVSKNRLDVQSVPESMQEIDQAVSRLVTMLDRLHRFAPVRSTQSNPRIVDLASLSEAAVTRIRESSEGVSITQSPAPNLPIATQNPEGLQQALWELLDNARRAAAQGGGKDALVEVSTFTRGDFVVVAVRDNGSGIPDDHRQAIFDPFFSTREQGSGLGLSLARALIVEDGGRMDLVDSSERGSAFEVEFPTGNDALVGRRK